MTNPNNMCTHAGRISQIGELKNGSLRFTIAAQNNFKTEDEYKAEFVEIVAFGQKAEIIKANKNVGDWMTTTSHLRNRKYDNNGATVYTKDLVLDEFTFGPSKMQA